MNSNLLIGGQAIIEGVMLRTKDILSVAVRKPNAEIVLHKEKILLLTSQKIFSFIFIRGIISLIQTIGIGIKTLLYSAELSSEEEFEKPSKFTFFWLILISFIFGIIIFVWLPLVITSFFATKISLSSFEFNFLDGILRLSFFLVYLLIISQMKDIRRIFQYHGAEHKVVHTYESGKECTIENAKKYSIIHPRCGTTFLLIVILLSIFVFSLLSRTLPFYLKFVYRLFLTPFIATIAYELIKFIASRQKYLLCKILLLPGLWLQKLTTCEPDEKQLEVAIAALKQLI